MNPKRTLCTCRAPSLQQTNMLKTSPTKKILVHPVILRPKSIWHAEVSWEQKWVVDANKNLLFARVQMPSW